MCGIAGFLDKTGQIPAVGQTLLAMLEALGCRGPDSSGVAIWGETSTDWLLRIKLGESVNAVDASQSQRTRAILAAAETTVTLA